MVFLEAPRQGETRLRVPPSREAFAGLPDLLSSWPGLARDAYAQAQGRRHHLSSSAGRQGLNPSDSVCLSRLFVFAALSLL